MAYAESLHLDLLFEFSNGDRIYSIKGSNKKCGKKSTE